MKFAGCFNGTKTSYMSKVQEKCDFSCHGSFNNAIKIPVKGIYWVIVIREHSALFIISYAVYNL